LDSPPELRDRAFMDSLSIGTAGMGKARGMSGKEKPVKDDL